MLCSCTVVMIKSRIMMWVGRVEQMEATKVTDA